MEAAALLPPEAHQAFEAVAREDLEASAGGGGVAVDRTGRAAGRRLAAGLARVRARRAGPDCAAWCGAELVTLARLALARGLEVAWHHPDPKAAAASLAALDLAEAAEQRAGRLTAASRLQGARA